ncbi:CBS domain-containing protein [Streptacidiphilus sp. ASG 303]|uniref:CBS domain-containing protein n=1 Tax=Streptomycetaceae TaxID=2062 RepID=UPI001E43B29E|nr:CBS domain-containing protein [Streptacidiphilus sp. ASG 303]MCD0486010.1 CBS domain-containing protein [Streptacidiphilus sp. ASG 303]
MQIKYAMSTPPASIPPLTTVGDAAQHMADASVGALPVVDDGKVVGIVTDRDLVVRALARGLSPSSRVDGVMSRGPLVLDADEDLSVAYRAMRTGHVRHLPVMSEGALVGMLAYDDLVWQTTQLMADLAATVGTLAETTP